MSMFRCRVEHSLSKGEEKEKNVDAKLGKCGITKALLQDLV